MQKSDDKRRHSSGEERRQTRVEYQISSPNKNPFVDRAFWVTTNGRKRKKSFSYRLFMEQDFSGNRERRRMGREEECEGKKGVNY